VKAGLYARRDNITWGFTLSYGLTDDGTVRGNAGASMKSGYVALGGYPLLPSVTDGITLGAGVSNAVGHPEDVSLAIPDLGVNVSYNVGANSGTIHPKLVISNLRVYCIEVSGLISWQIRWDDLQLYGNGTLYYSTGPVTKSNAWPVPAGIPLLGIPPTLTAGAGANVALADPCSGDQS